MKHANCTALWQQIQQVLCINLWEGSLIAASTNTSPLLLPFKVSPSRPVNIEYLNFMILMLNSSDWVNTERMANSKVIPACSAAWLADVWVDMLFQYK